MFSQMNKMQPYQSCSIWKLETDGETCPSTPLVKIAKLILLKVDHLHTVNEQTTFAKPFVRNLGQ